MKLNFIYSPIYDNLLTDMSRKEFSNEQTKEMEFYKEEFAAIWEKDEEKVMKEIEKVANLKFNGNRNCFIVRNMKYAAISRPLTIKRVDHLDRAKTILIHELIHNLLEDNKNLVKSLIEKIYPLESTEFKIHVPVLLITKKVVENIYNEKILDEIIKDEMKREVLDRVWPTVNLIYPKFRGDIVKFLKNEKLF